jgi:hypothetical protein
MQATNFRNREDRAERCASRARRRCRDRAADRRRGVIREGVHDLLSGPAGGRMLGDIEMDDPSAMVSEHDENEEHTQARGGHREEIEGDQIADMVGED